MANQPQPRPWLRLGSLARPVQPLAPPPAPAPRPQMQPPAALLPRPTMTRPTFRPPVGTQAQPVQNAAPPLQAPRPRPPPPLPVSPPKLLPRIATMSSAPQKSPPASPVTQKSPPASPVTQKSPPAPSTTGNSPRGSPVSQKSPWSYFFSQNSPPYASPRTQKSPPLASPVTQKSPVASPVTRKLPLAPAVTQNTPASSVTQKDTNASPIAQKFPPVAGNPPQTSVPSSPKPKLQSPPPPIQQLARLMPASPAKLSSPSPPSTSASPYLKSSNGLINRAINPLGGARMPTPAVSPRAEKPLPETPPQSPKIKSALHSPPLFSLPPSQLKSDGESERKMPAVSEQKAMLHVQDTVGKPRSIVGVFGDSPEKAQIGMSVRPKERDSRKTSNSEDTGMRVISISGENRGAIMELGFSPTTHGKTHGSVSSYQKLQSKGKLSEGNLSSNDGRSNMQGRNQNARANPSRPMHAFMNSNVQGINSSIVFNSTLSHHDPGVHLSLNGKPLGHLKEHGNGQKTLKKEAGYGFSD